MKICIVHAGAELYGADNVLLTLIAECATAGMTVTVFLPCEGPLVAKLTAIPGVSVKVFPFAVLRRRDFSLLGLFRYTVNFLASVAWLGRELLRLKPDVVHSNTSVVLPAAFAAKFLAIPHIWHIHEIVVKPLALGKLLAWLHFVLSFRVIAVSEAVKQQLVRYQPRLTTKVQVIYNGIDVDRFHPDAPREAFRQELGIGKDDVLVGMIGRVNRWKGQAFFLDVVESLLPTPGVHFALVGGTFEGEEQLFADLQKRVSTSGRTDIHVLDFRADTPSVHAAFDVFVLPSIAPDPLPTVVLEAMATGRPVVATRHGGACEMVLDDTTGYLVSPTDTREMAQRIKQLIESQSLRAELGQLARERVLIQFSIARYASEFKSCYQLSSSQSALFSH